MTASGESRRIPDFFIVGHPKSGTTALYEMLRSHPQIFMPDLKEPRYFATDLRSRFQPQLPAGAPRLVLPETLEEYLALFEGARPEQRVGEASPSYLRSRTAAALIAQAQPSARIIAILREPASFLRSLHLELVQNHVEREQDLREALAGEDLGRESSSGGASAAPLPRYSDRVRYVEQLRRYDAVFAPEQMLVLIYDDFRNDNETTVRRVLRFLDVDDRAPVRLIEANPTVHVRSLRLDRVVRSLYAGQGPLARTTKATVKALTPRRLHGESFALARRRLVYGTPDPPDQDLMLELRRRFKHEVLALERYLNRDLVSLWGYDGVE
jgi:sulfotransferase family protein